MMRHRGAAQQHCNARAWDHQPMCATPRRPWHLGTWPSKRRHGSCSTAGPSTASSRTGTPTASTAPTRPRSPPSSWSTCRPSCCCGSTTCEAPGRAGTPNAYLCSIRRYMCLNISRYMCLNVRRYMCLNISRYMCLSSGYRYLGSGGAGACSRAGVPGTWQAHTEAATGGVRCTAKRAGCNRHACALVPRCCCDVQDHDGGAAAGVAERGAPSSSSSRQSGPPWPELVALPGPARRGAARAWARPAWAWAAAWVGWVERGRGDAVPSLGPTAPHRIHPPTRLRPPSCLGRA